MAYKYRILSLIQKKTEANLLKARQAPIPGHTITISYQVPVEITSNHTIAVSQSYG